MSRASKAGRKTFSAETAIFVRRNGHRVLPSAAFFVEKVKDALGFKAIGRKVLRTGDVYELKARAASYRIDFDGKMSTLRPGNSIQWRVYNANSIG